MLFKRQSAFAFISVILIATGIGTVLIWVRLTLPNQSKPKAEQRAQAKETAPTAYDVASSGIEPKTIPENREKLAKFVKTLNHETMKFPELSQRLSETQTLMLIDMLNDESFKMNWRELIILLSFSGVPELTVPAFVDVARRPDDWSVPGSDWANDDRIVTAKLDAISTLGNFTLPAATEFLQHAVTRDGAKEVVDGWGDGIPYPWNLESVYEINSVRSSAAIGLVRTNISENIALVEEQLAALVSRHINYGT